VLRRRKREQKSGSESKGVNIWARLRICVDCNVGWNIRPPGSVPVPPGRSPIPSVGADGNANQGQTSPGTAAYALLDALIAYKELIGRLADVAELRTLQYRLRECKLQDCCESQGQFPV